MEKSCADFYRFSHVLLAFPSSSFAADATTQPTLFERFARMTPRVFRDHVRANWFAKGTKFWYRNDLANGEKEFVLVDAAKGLRMPAFDSGRVAAAMGVSGGAIFPSRGCGLMMIWPG